MSTFFSQPRQPAAHASALVRLTVNEPDWLKLIQYADAAGINEICGYAWVKRVNSTSFEFAPGSIFIPEQFVAPGASEPTAAGSSEMMDATEEWPEDYIQMLWHSHTCGTAQFSGTDMRTHNRFASATLYDTHMFLVINQFGDAQAFLEVYNPVRTTVPLCVTFIHEVDDNDVEELADDVYYDKLKQFPKPAKTMVTTVEGV